jgi:hypothetical protein
MAAGAITVMITSACIGLSGNGHDACTKAAEAGAIQSGLDQNVGAFQKQIEQDADKKAHEYFGQTGMQIAGGTVFIVKTVADKAVKADLPNFGLCDKITSEVGINKYSLNLKWNF